MMATGAIAGSCWVMKKSEKQETEIKIKIKK